MDVLSLVFFSVLRVRPSGPGDTRLLPGKVERKTWEGRSDLVNTKIVTQKLIAKRDGLYWGDNEQIRIGL